MTQKKNQRSRQRADAVKETVERVEQVIELLHHLDSLRDQERKDLSRELHNTLVASLSATKLECDWLLRAQRKSEAEKQRRLARMSISLAEAILFTRGVIDQLWPAAVQHLGLVAAIQGQLSELHARLGVDVRPNVEGDLETLPEAHAMMLYRAVQETLRLPAKHATPARIELTLRRGGKGVELRLDLASAATHENWFLSRLEEALMRERVMRLHGEYLFADNGQGAVHLRLFLPLPPRGAGPVRAASRSPRG